ncbi:Uncharacterised protein [Vibrio cholerae]|nr:Uncharacterised protein [Vibrio cholerae]
MCRPIRLSRVLTSFAKMYSKQSRGILTQT